MLSSRSQSLNQNLPNPKIVIYSYSLHKLARKFKTTFLSNSRFYNIPSIEHAHIPCMGWYFHHAPFNSSWELDVRHHCVICCWCVLMIRCCCIITVVLWLFFRCLCCCFSRHSYCRCICCPPHLPWTRPTPRWWMWTSFWRFWCRPLMKSWRWSRITSSTLLGWSRTGPATTSTRWRPPAIAITIISSTPIIITITATSTSWIVMLIGRSSVFCQRNTNFTTVKNFSVHPVHGCVCITFLVVTDEREAWIKWIPTYTPMTLLLTYTFQRVKSLLFPQTLPWIEPFIQFSFNNLQ